MEFQLEKTLCFTGPRPQKLGGFDFYNPVAMELRGKLDPLLIRVIEEEGIDTFISGGALGVDQIAFERVQAIKAIYPHIRNIVAAPFQHQDIKWNQDQRGIYRVQLEQADAVIYVDTLAQYRAKYDKTPVGDYSAVKMELRNHFMVDHSRIVIAVFDGVYETVTNGKTVRSGTGNCVKYAKKCEKGIWRLDPTQHFALTSI